MGAPPRSPFVPRRRITGLHWINEHEECHLMTASDDGTVRVWDGSALTSLLMARAESERMAAAAREAGASGGRGGGTSGRGRDVRAGTAVPGSAGAERGLWGSLAAPPLLASFSALPELHSFPPAHSGDAAADSAGGLTLQWMPSRCHLVAGGGRAPYVRIWDLQTQQCTSVVPINVFAGAFAGVPPAMHVTSLTTAWPGTDVIAAGTSNGTIQLIDLRVGRSGGSGGAVVHSLREHKRYVVNVTQARSGSVYSMVSGSVQSDVRFWDLRRPSGSVAMMQAHKSASMTSLTVHDFAPLIATGSRKQHIRVSTNSGEVISDIRYHDGFVGQRIGPVLSLAFHPHRLYLAAGTLDNIISVYHGVPAAATEA